MSGGENLTLSKLATNLSGVILLALGLVIAYYSTQADVGHASPSIFTPIGLIVALLGGILIIAWEG
jgi:hypothetical protein